MGSKKPTGSKGGRNESIPGEWDERSIEVDLEVVHEFDSGSGRPPGQRSLADLWPHERKTKETKRPDVILFDPMGFKLAAHLTSHGFPFRVATSGVDVMGLIAAKPTGLVLCGPSEDAERRRLLTAAVRVRFPRVPVIYASTHARNPDAVAGAKREGAHSVVPIPLPTGDAFDAFLLPHVKKGPSTPQQVGPPKVNPPVPPPVAAAHPATQALDAPTDAMTAFDDNSLPNTVAAPPDETAEHISFDSFDDFEDAKTDAMDLGKLEEIERDGAEHEASVIRPRRVADGKGMWTFPEPNNSTPPVVMKTHEGDSNLANASAFGPFLWGLDDALEWTHQKAREGHIEAVTHARTLASIRQILKAMVKKEERSRD